MRWVSRFAVLMLCWTGCAAHEKSGDRAAAVGEWKGALKAYQQALMDDPSSPQLRRKYQQAKQEAVAASVRRAQSCASLLDWQCALNEADFALGLDASNPELTAFRVESARSFSRALLQHARDDADHQRFHSAFEQWRKATRVNPNDPGLREEAEQTRARVVELGAREAERLREGEAFVESIALLRELTSVDGSQGQRLREVEAEYARRLEAEYERVAQEGDAALGQKQWREAREKYEAALRIKPGGRAEPLARYTRGMDQGESALARRDFTASAEGYRQASRSGLDRDGAAAAQLARVEVRPYTVRIRSVLAHPARPDGAPWVGKPNPLLGNLIKAAARATLNPLASTMTKVIINSAQEVPVENRPTLSVIVSRPDGERLKTPARNGLYVVYDSSLVINSNHFDERRLNLRVVHADGADDVGTVELPLGALLATGGASVSNQSIDALELSAEPAEGLDDGVFTEMIPVSDENNRAVQFSRPSERTHAFRLTRVQAGIAPGDYQNELGLDGAPDTFVELEQAGRIVYRSPIAQDRRQGDWGLKTANLFVEPGEQLVVRVWDADASSDDLALSTHLSARALDTGSFQSRTQRGSFVTLSFEPRPVEAPRAMARLR